MKASRLLKSKNCYSLALAVMILMVAACTQQTSEQYSDTPPTSRSNTSDAYDFPIKPGTDAWRAFNSHGEMVNACQIPEIILQNMSTSGLIDTVMSYPLLGNIMAYDNPQLGFNSVSAQFNGLTELLKRKDAGTLLFEKYSTMDPSAIGNNWTGLQKGSYSINFFYIETILAQESILSTLTTEQLQMLLEQANTKLQAKQNYSEVYSLSSTVYLIDTVTLRLDNTQSE